jgi:Lysyl oxidase
MRRKLRSLSVSSLSLLLLTFSLALSATPAAAATDRLPDLKISYPRAFMVDTATLSGHRLLRFTTIVNNAGVGPFEVRGSRPDTSASTMSVSQVIYDDAGGSRTVPTSAVMIYDTGDGHSHWHLKALASYQLKNSAGTQVATSPKIGFCFFDGVAWQLTLPGAPQSAVYPRSGCGTTSSLSVRTGLSVGWGDKYPYNVANQWIDVTNLADGDYRVVVKADPRNFFLESADGNNSNYAVVRLAGTSVSMLSHGPK